MSTLLRPTVLNFWLLYYPIMLSIASQSIMTFCDKLFLAKYSLRAMEAASTAGVLAFSFIFSFGLCIRSISLRHRRFEIRSDSPVSYRIQRVLYRTTT